MARFNPRIWLRQSVQYFPKWKQLFKQWLNAPSLAETVQEQRREWNEYQEGANQFFQDFAQQLFALEDLANSINRRLALLEEPVENVTLQQGLVAPLRGHA